MYADELGTLGDGSGVELEQAPGVTLMGQSLRATMEGSSIGMAHCSWWAQEMGRESTRVEKQKSSELSPTPPPAPHPPLFKEVIRPSLLQGLDPLFHMTLCRIRDITIKGDRTVPETHPAL